MGSSFSHRSFSLLLCEVEFSIIKLFVKSKSEIKVFPNHSHNRRKIGEAGGITVVQKEDGGTVRSAGVAV